MVWHFAKSWWIYKSRLYTDFLPINICGLIMPNKRIIFTSHEATSFQEKICSCRIWKTCIVYLWSSNNLMATHNQKISSIFRCNISIIRLLDSLEGHYNINILSVCICNCKSASKIYLLQLVYYSSVDLLFHVRTMVMKGAQTRKEFLY